MDCTEFEKLLENYETLTAEDKLKLSEHAAQCDACSQALADYIAMTKVLNSLPKLKAPEDFLSKLNERIDKEIPAQKGLWHNLKQHSYRYGAIAACVALVAIVGMNNTELVDKMIGKDTDDAEVVVSEISDFEIGDSLPVITAEPDATPLITAVPATAAPVEATQKPATQKPIATAIPQKKQTKATARPTAKPTAKPVERKATQAPTQEPEPIIQETEAPVYDEVILVTEAPEVQTPTEISQVAMVSDVTETQNPMMDPSEYQLPDSDTSRTSRIVDGYEHSAKNPIVVSYANAEIAKEIINEYSVAVEGDCYSVSRDAMEAFILAMNDAGIEIDQSSIQLEEDIATFQLIIS